MERKRESAEDISWNNTCINIYPDYSKSDTAFARVLFSVLPIYREILAELLFIFGIELTLTAVIKERGKRCELIKWCVSDEDELFVALADAVYNFDGYIDNPDLCDRFSELQFIVRGDEKVLVLNLCHYEELALKNDKQDENGNSHKPVRMIEYKEDKVDSWGKIKEDILEKLYLDGRVKGEIENIFVQMSEEEAKILSEILGKYKKELKNFDILYDGAELSPDEMRAFPSVRSIGEYIDAYYQVAVMCFKEHELFTQSKVAFEILNRIINFGVKQNEDESFWLLSPYALNSLRNVYERSNTFATELCLRNDSTYGIDRSALECNFIANCLMDFKRWIYVEDSNRLVSFEGQENTLRNYKCNRLSSIALVRPIRLYEKIKGFVESLEEKPKVLKICIVSYSVDRGGRLVEIDELSEMLEAGMKDVECTFTVLINKKKSEKDKGHQYDNVKVQKIKYDILFEKNRLKKELDKYNMIFFIDCPNLYYDEFTQKYNGEWETIYNSLKGTTYDANYRMVDAGKSLEKRGLLYRIEEQLAVMSNRYSTGYGSYLPSIKEYLIDYFNDYIIKSEDKAKIIYCYLSSMTTRDKGKYNRSNAVHQETYSGKTFNIIKLSKEDKIILGTHIKPVVYPCDGVEYVDCMCFSLWNFTKNVFMRSKETWFRLNEGVSPNVLENIGICLRWDAGMSRFLIQWGFGKGAGDKKKYAGKGYQPEAITEYIRNIMMIAFKMQPNMLYTYIRDAICNIILGRAENSAHMILYYLLKTGGLVIENLECKELADYEQLEAILDKNKISTVCDKRLYFDVMTVYNQYPLNEFSVAGVKLQIERNGGNQKEIFDNITKACEAYGKKDLNLYKNLRSE